MIERASLAFPTSPSLLAAGLLRGPPAAALASGAPPPPPPPPPPVGPPTPQAARPVPAVRVRPAGLAARRTVQRVRDGESVNEGRGRPCSDRPAPAIERGTRRARAEFS